MEKTKLAICMEDEEYRTRFVQCVMNHYKDSFEIHVVNHIQDFTAGQNKEVGVIITGDGKEINQGDFEGTAFLVLQEEVLQEEALSENVYYTEKYQEVYKIIENVEKIAKGKNYSVKKRIERREMQQVGIFSLGKEVMQIPFAALLAEILGESSRVLVMDIQPFSGLAMEVETEDSLGMEDMMSIATTENYTVNRLAASIGHEQKWDFIYPVKNFTCLTEVGAELYHKILDILQKEQSYDYVIINFGAVFPGMVEFMESCHQMYLLTDKKEERNWREKSFLAEMSAHGRVDFLKRICWLEIPMEFVREKSWQQLTKNWLWSELGDKLRELYWMENRNGESM